MKLKNGEKKYRSQDKTKNIRHEVKEEFGKHSMQKKRRRGKTDEASKKLKETNEKKIRSKKRTKKEDFSN